MRRVSKGFSGVDTPLFKGMLVPKQVNHDIDVDANVADDVDDNVAPTSPPSPHQSPIAPPSSPPPQHQPSHTIDISMDLLNTLLETCTTLTRKVETLKQDKIAQALEITKLKKRVRRLEKKTELKEEASKSEGKIVELDADEDVTLEEVAAEITKDTEVQGRLEESQAEVYHLDSEHAQYVLHMQDDEAEPAKLKEVIEVVTTAKLMTEVVTAAATTITTAPSTAKRRKGVVIRDPKETATPSIIVYSESKYTNKGKGMTYDDIRPIFEKNFNSNVAFLEKGEEQLEDKASKAIKRKSETSKEKVAKKHKLDEEVEELKTHLQIIPNNEDNVYTEATPLALKVPVVYYQIHTENNKPYYKIIKVDGTQQLFLSFISLLRNFDREDLGMLWQIVQARFASSEPKNISDDFLLNTLKAMFEKPNVEAHIYDLASRKKMSFNKVTLDQMLNNVRLEVKEESEVSFFRVDAVEDFKEYTLRDYYCWLRTYCCWYKLKLLDNAADLS
uniref:Uncharacterized protein n=1 Tax=Tanacetum cinerariifolium TaxID=118510 RepID=A0A699GGC7_TANCI|nr:hypothetical protein [Tanacetum cinerariifolium]